MSDYKEKLAISLKFGDFVFLFCKAATPTEDLYNNTKPNPLHEVLLPAHGPSQSYETPTHPHYQLLYSSLHDIPVIFSQYNCKQ